MAKIYVSPSTQGSNAYAGGGNERDNMRAVRDHLLPMLRAAGHEVQTCNVTNDIATPVRQANKWGAEWYVAIHTNATGRGGGSRGVSAHIYARGGKADQLARAIINEAAKLSPVGTRGVQVNKFYEVRATNMPAVLTENDFHDDARGAAWIRANHRTIAIWHARAICSLAGGGAALERYLSGNATPTPTPTPAPAPVDIEALARAVIRGEYGNGGVRKRMLGANYAAVQARVNQILRG